MPAPAADDNAPSVADLAVERGLITRDQLLEAVEVHAKLSAMGVPDELGKILLKKGMLSEAQLRELEGAAGTRQPVNIAGFEIISRLGRGGMGAVYKARQVSMDRIVALKILPPGLAKDQSFVDRFMREARTVAKLNHPNIVQGIDVGTSGKYHYFAMEYVEGETLQTLIAREGAMPERRALEVVLQIAQALHHAHRNGMVHRDVKPDNIMVMGSGVAKLCDLGLAKSMAGDSTLTQTGMAVGTPHYLSPEQARGDHDVDIRSDIYSLGATLYHMVLGRTPFSGSSAAVVMTKHLSEEPQDPREVRPELTAGLAALVMKMMAKERDARYESPEALINDLNLVLAGRPPAGARLLVGTRAVRPVAARPNNRRTTPRPVAAVPEQTGNRKVLFGLIGLGVLAVAGLVIGLLLAGGGGDGGPAPLPPPENGKGTEPPPADPEKEAARKRLEELSARYDEIAGRARKGPSAALVAELDRLTSDAAGTPIAIKARAESDRLSALLKQAGEDSAARIRERSAELEKQEKFGEAIKLHDGLPIPDMLRERGRIEALAQARFDALKAEAGRILAAGKYDEKTAGAFDEAVKCLNRSTGFGLPRIDEQRDAAIAELQKSHEALLADRDKRLADARAALRADFIDKRGKVFEAAARMEPDAATGQPRVTTAAKLARATLLTEAFKPFAGEATRIVRDLEALDAFLGKMPEMIRARRGAQIRIISDDRGQEEGSLEDVKPTGIEFRPKGMPVGAGVTVPMRKISPACLAELAGLSPSAPGECYLTGLLAFFSNRPGDAVAPLETAARQAALRADAEYYLAMARTTQKTVREQQAGDRLRDCRERFRQYKDAKVPDGDPRWVALRAELEKLQKDFADTDVVKANLGE
ncbi:MAG TPA: protein kinase [Planctomycetota bacterium]|nr:protein kinase [Planctomycetota bacterium]